MNHIHVSIHFLKFKRTAIDLCDFNAYLRYLGVKLRGMCPQGDTELQLGMWMENFSLGVVGLDQL